ncbi:MAG: DUF1566 domain-containing protein, partial [Gammaproteobacteria bacterium]|nr:DUF1566 domain-containing protein [Gammaproteobacteria bacterium]
AQTRVPAINQPWPEQGGIYIGSRLVDGEVHHVVIPGGVEFDHEEVPFNRVEKVVNEGDELNGFSDWRAPDQEDLMLAYINAREHFMQKGVDSIYWSRSEHHDWPWAVDFEDGRTSHDHRYNEFRVRPVRSFSDSSL